MKTFRGILVEKMFQNFEHFSLSVLSKKRMLSGLEFTKCLSE